MSKKKSSAGRKPLPKGMKKVSVTIFPTQHQVDACGGKEKAKDIALLAIIRQTVKSSIL